MKREPKYKSEAALCAAFIPWAETQGLKAYAESCGWDILLVAADGTQIGVQAKMTFNMKVLHQVLETSTYWNAQGPDFRTILIPDRDGAVDSICSALGIGVFNGDWSQHFHPELIRKNHYLEGGWLYWNPLERHKLPEYVPDVAAGMSAPIQLTQWKIAALKIIALLDLRGFVTRDDFKRYGIDRRRWVTLGWITPGGANGGYIRGAGTVFDSKSQHPTVWPQVLADVTKELEKLPRLQELAL